MELRKINDITAIDDEGVVWFRHEMDTPHRTWITCMNCFKRVKVYWYDYPNMILKIGEECIEWEE